MKILIVEDDYLQAELIQEGLNAAFPGVDISHIKTESAFRSRLKSIVDNPPDVVIMDMMIRWTDPLPDLPPAPPEVREEGHYRAGLRCQRLLAQSEATAGIPIIIYSVLEREDLQEDLKGTPMNVMYLSKDFEFKALIRFIRSCVQTDIPTRHMTRGRIFIGHGRSPLWARAQIFLEKEMGLAAFSYESETHVGESIVPVLESMAEQANFAVLILTAEDETAVGAKRARQNVVHEAGLFQGKLGFRKAVLLLQEGLEGFTNIDGLQTILFSGDRIDQTFFELQRVLKREKIL
jgi:predicted nucleotide-binding protein